MTNNQNYSLTLKSLQYIPLLNKNNSFLKVMPSLTTSNCNISTSSQQEKLFKKVTVPFITPKNTPFNYSPTTSLSSFEKIKTHSRKVLITIITIIIIIISNNVKYD